MLLLGIIPIKYFEHIICRGEMNFLGASVLIYSLYLFLHAIVASRLDGPRRRDGGRKESMTAAKIQDANNNNKKTRQRDEVGHGNDDHSEEFLSLPRCKAQRDREAEAEEANITFNYNIAAFY